MSPTRNYLAIDLGAESGRAVLGRFDGERITLEPYHRFSNGAVPVLGRLYWDILHLYREIRTGLGMARRVADGELASIGLDTWGVDFGLLDEKNALVDNPRHYRDPRNDGILERAYAIVPRDEIFAQTGLQFMQINSLFQLLAMKLDGDPALAQARRLLMIPDLLNYWLTGVQVSEFSVATTTQFYDPNRRAWALPLMERFGLPTDLLAEIVPSGTALGPLTPALAEEAGLADVQVVAPACHDTGSAVAAVPARDADFCYISSGTWSLMGIETPEPLINADTLAYNFTNEGGVCDTFRVLKNIMGLWLVQECRRTWAAEGDDLSYDQITALAAAAPAFGPLVEPDAHDFLAPGNMPTRIAAFCRRTGQAAPEGRGGLLRCALESLALKYRWCLEKMEVLRGRRIETIHIVGGGSQNTLLCQFTADATGRTVVAGPVEATALGNILMQMLAAGQIDSLAQGREIVRRSSELITYRPGQRDGWDAAYERYLALREQVPTA